MNEFTIDILLEFLYKKFAITFVLCFFGSVMRKLFSSKTKTDPNNKKNLVGEVIISAVFSTFLMCAVADYVNIDLHFEVYAIISILIGIWGLKIITIVVDGKFLISFIKNLAKNATNNPVIKSAIQSASDTLSENDITEDEDESQETNDN